MKKRWVTISAEDCGKSQPEHTGIYSVVCPDCGTRKDVYTAKSIGGKRAREQECNNCEVVFRVLVSGKVQVMR